MRKPAKPLVFRFQGNPKDSGADRFPGCVTFQIYMNGSAHKVVMDWLEETCPDGHQFGTAKAWRRHGPGKPHLCDVPVLHIFDRGVAAMFKMVFARTEHEMREYQKTARRNAYQRRRAA